jgi:hypothetical protein
MQNLSAQLALRVSEQSSVCLRVHPLEQEKPHSP